jgi:hypothetical protein
MSEHRAKERHRTFKGGKITFNNAASVFDCTVRNISETGACLMVENALAIPAQFELVFEGNRSPCEVVWRQANRVGVRFSCAASEGADALSGAPCIVAGPRSNSPVCPKCRVGMPLIHSLPAKSDLPEVQAFKCDHCGEIVICENDEPCLVASN